MLIGYARVSKADGTQLLDLQRDALIAAGIEEERIYEDRASGRHDHRPGLEACPEGPATGQHLRRLEARPPGTQPETPGDNGRRTARPRRRPAGARRRRDRHHDGQRPPGVSASS